MYKNKYDIVILLYGNIKYDGRVQKEIKTFLKNNKQILLIVSDFDNDDLIKNYNYDIKIIRNKLDKRGSFFTFINLLLFNFLSYAFIKRKSVDFIHCNDLNTMLFSRSFAKKGEIIYDAHELFPEAQSSKIKQYIWNLIEKMNIKNANVIIQTEKNRRLYFAQKYNLELNNIKIIENFPLKSVNLKYKDYYLEKYKINRVRKKIVSYIGVISPDRCVLEMIQALNKFQDIIFICIGNYPNIEYKRELKEYIKINELEDRFLLMKSIPQIEVIDATKSSDISIVFYKNNNLNNYYCASNKLYEALNNGVKILTNNYPGIYEVTKHIENVYRVNAITTIEIEKGIEYLLNINKATNASFYWEDQERMLIDLYRKRG